ncbi:hypothetical protein BJ878DRAFT_568985 [Calycina marina]|uniref:RING-type E3 ubiquitin transferase n=1 Tax=Calycina marina TaxID=1763456 RepID=A0A9P7Z006_9HELO|nr:hypothetical protein BJ878DRAFT_568985 [Calycina marina]
MAETRFLETAAVWPSDAKNVLRPDLMNDPISPNISLAGEDGMSDQCRICRGEATAKEPLFHPCKCSGSIKHVHQDCLMEWLSHSQKKHCELCKTPFRFTKLYSPNMPHKLPTRVFVQHFFLHSARNLATWLRFCLVVTVWLGCLPFVIRQVWRVLFWLSDGGWPARHMEKTGAAAASSSAIHDLGREVQASLAANGTSPAMPWLAAQTTPASIGEVIGKFLDVLKPFSQMLNISAVDPLAAGLIKGICHGLNTQVPSTYSQQTANGIGEHYVVSVSPAARSLSLLSEISVLKNLTRYTYVNELVISIAEGYIISILVVVCFILVFLIREWVVQQQPNINAGAAFNADFPAPPQPQPPVDVRPEEIPLPDNAVPEADLVPRPLARPRRANRPGPIQMDNTEFVQPVTQAPNRPAPVRDALTPAAEIQRQLAEDPGMTEEFISIWRRADSNPEEVLRIIERENKGDELSYWVNAMKRSQATEQDRQGFRVSTAHALSGSQPADLSTSQEDSDHGSASGEGWIDIPESIDTNSNSSLAEIVVPPSAEGISSRSPLNKGKRKAEMLDEVAQAACLTAVAANKLPEDASTGVQTNETSLEFSNWSFNNLDNQHKQSSTTTLSNNENSSPSIPGSSTPVDDTRRFGERRGSGLRPSQANRARRSQSLTDAKEVYVPRSFISGHLQTYPDLEVVNPAEPAEIIRSDDTTQTYPNLQEMLLDNPLMESDSDAVSDAEQDPAGSLQNNSEPNPFAPDGELPHEPLVPNPPAQPLEGGLFDAVVDWIWGPAEIGLAYQHINDEHIVEDLDAEAPFIPFAHDDVFAQVGGPVEPDREAVEAARAAGIDPNDPDAIEDAEDFEGIMELIGMRGPLFSLVQNSVFSAFLLSLTVVFGVWIPYNIGRVSLLLLANPGPAFKLPLRLLFWFAALLQDIAAVALGLVSSITTSVVTSVWGITGMKSGSSPVASEWGLWSLRFAREALGRITDNLFGLWSGFSDSDIFIFSAASHEALLTIQYRITDILESIGRAVISLCIGDYKVTVNGLWAIFSQMLARELRFLFDVPSYFVRPDSWVISLEMAKRTVALDLELSVWGGWDRLVATLAGYTTLSLLGAAYVKRSSPLSEGQAGREWEATIIDLLNQAGGVMKVILIISIEMLVFPLYCGLLLDAALLPLFENATLVSRILFTFKSPLTSIFVHWFVGTCYMFHFALFVSMCRKIMRKGVLYFIRDPDDPTFHPVRDVLERNVATQLRKILFSALVYGALVIVCLGGVVWGLAYTFQGVLPIYWSSNEPVLEFPIDLLFYNFLMPLAVKFFKPSDGLHAMYAWWFRQCAGMLRLTWFMFDERQREEEGHIVGRSWKNILLAFTGRTLPVLHANDPNLPFVRDEGLNAYIRRDGCYVRAPASDQVRIKKGSPIFLRVDEFNERLPRQPARRDRDPDWDSDIYKQVYIPPNFRLRIFAFILSIWLFAAMTGVCITVVPLVFGRHVFGRIIPTDVRKNDIYAFSIGIYILGSALYMAVHLRDFWTYVSTSLSFTAETPAYIFRLARIASLRVARTAWTYSAVLLLLPTLFALLIEFYAILPLHTYISDSEPHTIHFVQSWTLGLLYVKLTTRLILFYPESRPAISLNAIIRDGYLNPDAWLATRSFVIPATLLLSIALAVPWCIAQLAIANFYQESSDQTRMLIFRYAYPAVLVAAGIGYMLYLASRAVMGWKMRIKDEVYLIGERLHNFGERQVTSPRITTPGALNVRRMDT